MNYRLVMAAGLLALAVACTDEPAKIVRLDMQTTLGSIELELYPEKAPITVEHFLKLVDGGHLDGATFYRTVSAETDNGNPPISVIQGGLRDTDSPLPPITHETTRQTGLSHVAGSISMARGEPGTANSEFFICIGAQPALDFGGKRHEDGQGFAVFGRVVGGMDVVQAIHKAPASAPTDTAYFRNQLLEEPVVIESVRRSEP